MSDGFLLKSMGLALICGPVLGAVYFGLYLLWEQVKIRGFQVNAGIRRGERK